MKPIISNLDTMRYYDGYVGAFTREQAAGALPNGTRVVKINSRLDDAHRDGASATILGSISHPTIGILYFVEWDDTPRCATAIMATRVKLAEDAP